MITVEIVYANSEQQVLLEVEVLPNATAEDAIVASGISQKFPEIDLTAIKIGVFSRQINLQTRLSAGDRVEIYRPLIIDPKQARQLRAKKR